MVEGKRDDGVRETKMLSAWSTGRMVFSTQLAAATEQKSNAMIWRYNAGAHLMIRTYSMESDRGPRIEFHPQRASAGVTEPFCPADYAPPWVSTRAVDSPETSTAPVILAEPKHSIDCDLESLRRGGAFRRAPERHQRIYEALACVPSGRSARSRELQHRWCGRVPFSHADLGGMSSLVDEQ